MNKFFLIKIVVIVILSGFRFYSFSQVDDLENIKNLHEKFDESKFETGIVFNTFAESNSINNSFISALYSKKYITNELKNSNRLKSLNYIGNQDNANFYFIHKPEKFLGDNNFGYRIGLVYHNGRDMKFTDDFFKLLFFGNKQLAGDTADLSNLQINLLTYQELQLGIFQQTSINQNPFTYYVGLSFIKGQDYNSLRFEKATVFTEETGEYIDLDLSMTYQGIDTVKSELADFNGIGGAMNFACIYTDKKHSITYSFSANNIGFIRWKNTAITIPVDTTKRFEGVEIDNVFDMGATNFTDYDADSVISDFFDRTDTGSYYKIIPERIHFAVKKEFSPKFFTTAGCGYYYNANARMPLFYLKSEYKFSGKFRASVFTGYGGYGNYQLGLGIKLYLLKNKLLGSVSSNNLLGLIIPDNSFSQNIYTGISYRF